MRVGLAAVLKLVQSCTDFLVTVRAEVKNIPADPTWRGLGLAARMGLGVNRGNGDQEGRADVRCIWVADRPTRYRAGLASTDRPG